MKSLDKTAKLYLIGCISSDGYDPEPETTAEKIAFVKSCFESEYGFAIKRMGYVSALREWLMGLPSCINIAFYNDDIIQLAIEWGSLPVDHDEKQADKIIDNYFNLMANKLNQLFTGYRVPKEGV